jgi:simple sugar transport system ATP-binding protein
MINLLKRMDWFMDGSECIVQMKNIRKTFGALAANNNISLNVKKGTVHALIGENGAGKSTLMNILTGIHKPDSGEIIIKGRKVVLRNSFDAAKLGIGMVYQEFMLFRDLTVIDNIIMGFEVNKGRFFIDKAKCRQKIEDICKQYHFNIPLDSKVNDLPVAILQQVEIVKVLYKGADIIIMDEPTSVLTPQGIRGLFEAIRYLAENGKTIIFITHKLKEVIEISDYITVLRNGTVTGNVANDGINENELAKLMVGRDVILEAKKIKPNPGEVILSVNNLKVKDRDGVLRVKGVNLEVKAGEIVGIAGVAGSGQQELVEALFGIREPEGGSEIIYRGSNIVDKSIAIRRCMGIGYVPQDRLGSGSNVLSNIWENSIMGYHIAHGFKNKIFLDHNEIDSFTNKIVEQYNVKIQNIDDKVNTLSGGNIQKLIVGREFIQDNKLLIVEDPTRGIDVGAIEFIWERIIEIAQSGVGILLISHELNEVMQLSDRIKVMYNGMLRDGGSYKELTEEQIGILMLGGEVSNAKQQDSKDFC